MRKINNRAPGRVRIPRIIESQIESAVKHAVRPGGKRPIHFAIIDSHFNSTINLLYWPSSERIGTWLVKTLVSVGFGDEEEEGGEEVLAKLMASLLGFSFVDRAFDSYPYTNEEGVELKITNLLQLGIFRQMDETFNYSTLDKFLYTRLCYTRSIYDPFY